ncbi:hypothetical protein L3Q82_002941 [Scortum barcoo]|uniref:Uncharacterized protein n=1 Tax=Scortum barcoo TaxID=214431 RepID=A0ACB8VVC4_9TELE|nr:hypothetical protein L3Q82_002941 [Scortum barcoo]
MHYTAEFVMECFVITSVCQIQGGRLTQCLNFMSRPLVDRLGPKGQIRCPNAVEDILLGSSPQRSRGHLTDPADYGPVALTSHVMKVLERLVLAQLRPQMRMFLDPLQFAYQPHLGVNDAVIYLLQRAHMHLDGGGGTVRITFFDFSSAFNTIQPLLLGEKLQVMGVDDTMISWITDYLTGRPQFVRLGSILSDVVVSDIGAPQGTVLSPFLFTLYTTDFQYNSESCHLQPAEVF